MAYLAFLIVLVVIALIVRISVQFLWSKLSEENFRRLSHPLPHH